MTNHAMLSSSRPLRLALWLAAAALLSLRPAEPLARQSPGGAARTAPEVARAPAPLPAPGRELDPAVAAEDVLNRYREAFNSLDAAALKSVWPTADHASLARAFSQLRSQEITFADCQMLPNQTDTHIGVTCRGSIRFVPRLGRRTERIEPRRWQFHLRHFNDGWRLENVESTDIRQITQ